MLVLPHRILVKEQYIKSNLFSELYARTYESYYSSKKYLWSEHILSFLL